MINKLKELFEKFVKKLEEENFSKHCGKKCNCDAKVENCLIGEKKVDTLKEIIDGIEDKDGKTTIHEGEKEDNHICGPECPNSNVPLYSEQEKTEHIKKLSHSNENEIKKCLDDTIAEKLGVSSSGFSGKSSQDVNNITKTIPKEITEKQHIKKEVDINEKSIGNVLENLMEYSKMLENLEGKPKESKKDKNTSLYEYNYNSKKLIQHISIYYKNIIKSREDIIKLLKNNPSIGDTINPITDRVYELESVIEELVIDKYVESGFDKSYSFEELLSYCFPPTNYKSGDLFKEEKARKDVEKNKDKIENIIKGLKEDFVTKSIKVRRNET